MYVAVKGGERAIENAHALLAHARRGDPSVPQISLAQISEQLTLAVDRVMNEGSLYDRELAARAIKQARGDLIEAIFLLRAYRTTLPRLAVSLPIDTGAASLKRRISATFKDLPGGQLLGPTFDYTHRLIDFDLAADGGSVTPSPPSAPEPSEAMPRVSGLLGEEGLIEPNPAGEAEVEIMPAELGFPGVIGEITVSECEMVNQFKGSATAPPQFTRGYGLAFGECERKAIAMALVDRALRAEELGEEVTAPAQDQEFVLSQSDNVEASGFVQHLKLPHYVD